MAEPIKRSEIESLVELNERRKTALSIFRPLPHQERVFLSKAREILLLGGNRSGKTTSWAALLASLAMDMPVTLADGTEVHCRRPHQRGKCLRIWTIGFDSRHVGETIYRVLFQKGLFDVITDRESGRMRAWKRWDADDFSRIKEKQESPPLIPARCIDQKSWSWDDKASRVFDRVTIINPITKQPTAVIHAYSSKSDPKQGDPCDIVAIDENIENERHYAEWRSRTVDRNGFLVWASWPSLTNDALYKLYELCEEEKNKTRERPLYECVHLTMSGNNALDEQAREDYLASCQTEEERMARDLGLFVTEQLRSYPLFDTNIHSAITTSYAKKEPDRLSRILEENNGKPPHDWTRYLILDPGTQHPAVLLVAIPPPEFGDYIVPYEEIYPGRADPWQLAKLVRQKTMGQAFHRFIVDFRAARQTTMGMKMEMTVYDAYSDAFESESLKCYMTGSRFEMGSDDVGGRIAIVRKWLHNDDKGFPKLRIVTGKCPELCKQMKKVKKAVANKEESDDRHAKGQTIDIVQTLEYAAAANLKYHTVKENPDNFSAGYKWYLKRFGNKNKDSQPNISIGTKYVPR